MRIDGTIWTGNQVNAAGANQPLGGWELESAQFVAARAGRELARLKASKADGSELDCAERRYRSALHMLQRIRSNLNDSSTAD